MQPTFNSPYYLFIEGKKEERLSISLNRTGHLNALAELDENMEVALHNPFTGYWTKWDKISLPRHLNISDIELAYDVHRKICNFEIVCESDYPLYSENVEAMRFVGSILEAMDYKCHYYYSAGKGVHIHIFVDYTQFNPYLKDFNFDKYVKTPEQFKEKFILFERENIFNLQSKYILDEQLMNGKHLIRSELSFNKKGFKTFLGYTYKDVTDIEMECNLETKEYPEIATFEDVECNAVIHRAKWTRYSNPKAKLQHFMEYLISQSCQRRKVSTLDFKPTEMRPLVKKLYENTHKYSEDGKKRVFFVIVNEIKNCYPKDKAQKLIEDWNARLGNPFEAHFLDYHLNREARYKLTNKYIEQVIRDVLSN